MSVSNDLALTQAQIAELDRRFAEYEANPDEGVTWEEVRDRIRHRHQGTPSPEGATST